MIRSHFLPQKHSTKGISWNVKKEKTKEKTKGLHNTDDATILMMLVFLVFSSSCSSVTQDICTKEKSWNVNNKPNNNKTKQFSVSYFTVLTHATFKKIFQSLQPSFNHSDQHFLKMNKTHRMSLKTKSNENHSILLHPCLPTKSTKHQFRQKKNDQPTSFVVTSFQAVYQTIKCTQSVQQNSHVIKKRKEYLVLYTHNAVNKQAQHGGLTCHPDTPLHSYGLPSYCLLIHTVMRNYSCAENRSRGAKWQMDFLSAC